MGEKIDSFIERTEKWKLAMIDDIIDNITRQLEKKRINTRARHIIMKNMTRLYEGGIPGWGSLIPRDGKSLNHDLQWKIYNLTTNLQEKREYCNRHNIKLK